MRRRGGGGRGGGGRRRRRGQIHTSGDTPNTAVRVAANKASIHVTANQATVKASRNETLSNMLRARAAGANREARHKASQSAPCWGPYKGAVVFALVMFPPPLSVFTSQSRPEDQEGRKHLPACLRKFIFRQTNAGFTRVGGWVGGRSGGGG